MTGFIDELLAEVIGQQVALMSAVARLEARTDGEALHDLRIALRRLRSLLRPIRGVPGVEELEHAAAEVGGSAGRSATWRCCCRRSPPKGCGMRWRCAGRCWSPATWRFSPASRCTACSFAWTSGRPCCVRPSGMPCWMACTAGCASACAGNGRPCAPSWRTPPTSTGTRYGYGSSACATGWRPIRTIAAFPARCWRRSGGPVGAGRLARPRTVAVAMPAGAGPGARARGLDGTLRTGPGACRTGPVDMQQALAGH